jgi:hypothetical protein
MAAIVAAIDRRTTTTRVITMEARTDDEREQMAEYGILQSEKAQYTYQGYVYDRLADAVAYARIDTKRNASRKPLQP